jgi:nitroreductase
LRLLKAQAVPWCGNASIQPKGDASMSTLQVEAGCDTGCIAPNVYLCCAAMGLATVVRGLIDRRHLAAALNLRPHQRVTLAQSVGHPLE